VAGGGFPSAMSPPTEAMLIGGDSPSTARVAFRGDLQIYPL